MKKIILFLAVGLLLFSCKKDHKNTPDPANKTYAVNFNISGFTQQIVGSTSKLHVNSLQTNTVDIASYFDYFDYVVYSGSTTSSIVHRTTIDLKKSGFSNNVSDNLPNGTYTIVFVAWKNGGVNVYPVNAYINAAPWTDTFFKKITITVSGGSINQDVSLDRILGQLSVQLKDIMPSNASSIAVTVNAETGRFFFTPQDPSETPLGPSTSTFAIPDSVKGKTGFKVSRFIQNDKQPFTTTIICYDASNKILAQTTVTNVSIQHNVQTLLTGYLFGANTGFNVVLNAGWDPTPINTQF
ncbi:MAG: hypothetical protein ACXVB0_19610 [Mucilaginibacter sp.]